VVLRLSFLKADPNARYQGYKFYFREGFCWSDINNTFLKCRKKQKSINDVKSMSLYSLTDIVSEFYFICLINSRFIGCYVKDFVNNTQTFQINDARQLPIIIPTSEQLKKHKTLYNRAVELKQKVFRNIAQESDIEQEISEIELNKKVAELYGII
jgi:hypothetical protein